jgi:hypothetical protein
MAISGSIETYPIQRQRGMRSRDITGERFFNLVAIGYVGQSSYLCRCDCESYSVVRSNNLRTGRIKSCGCQSKVRRNAANTTHGKAYTDIYKTWEGMLQRCLNRKNDHYHIYGGRGIRVCNRWLNFEKFLADMGERPGPGYSLDRKDNDGHYEPGNVRWATHKEQCNNTRRNVCAQINGVRMTGSEIGEKFGIDSTTVRDRIKRGCCEACIVAKPPIHCTHRGMIWAAGK